MEIEDKQKAMLADALSAYIKDKHTQEECIGFIDGYNAALVKILGIADVESMPKCCNASCEKPIFSPDGVYCEYHRDIC